MSKSAFKSSRQPSISKNNRHTRFNRFVRTLSDSPEEVDLEYMVKNQENQPRIKNQYKQPYTGFKHRYSRSKRALQQILMKWQSNIEFKKALAEKREEEFNFERKWSIKAVKDDKVSICNRIADVCKTISKRLFNFFFKKTPMVGDIVTVQRGGKRTQKKRKFNTRKRRPKVKIKLHYK